MSVLEKIKEVRLPKPSDHVIKQLKDLIARGELKPGDLLPGERELATRFGLGRGYIREAIKTCEIYGIFKSIPGKGTVVSDLSLNSYSDFMNNIIQFGVNDHMDLLDARSIMEPQIAYRAALHATDEEIESIRCNLEQYKNKLDNGDVDLDTECQFHLEIAKATHNRFLSISMGIILPDLTNLGRDIDVLRDHRAEEAFKEHKDVYEAIAKRDPEAAQAAMQHHMDKSLEQYTRRLEHMRKEKA